MTHSSFLNAMLVTLLIGILAGCAEPADLSGLNEDDLREVSNQELCEAYHYGRADNVRNEINRRQLIREPRWNQVDAQKIGPGMTECAVLAALGTPDRTEALTDRDKNRVLIYHRENRTLRIHFKENRACKIEKKNPND